jgi:hypothetical protein
LIKSTCGAAHGDPDVRTAAWFGDPRELRPVAEYGCTNKQYERKRTSSKANIFW